MVHRPNHGRRDADQGSSRWGKWPLPYEIFKCLLWFQQIESFGVIKIRKIISREFFWKSTVYSLCVRSLPRFSIIITKLFHEIVLGNDVEVISETKYCSGSFEHQTGMLQPCDLNPLNSASLLSLLPAPDWIRVWGRGVVGLEVQKSWLPLQLWWGQALHVFSSCCSHCCPSNWFHLVRFCIIYHFHHMWLNSGSQVYRHGTWNSCSSGPLEMLPHEPSSYCAAWSIKSTFALLKVY